MVADSSDSLKRQRGRRGLEVLQRIQKMLTGGKMRMSGGGFPQPGTWTTNWSSSRGMGAKIVTNDFNLNKCHGARVLVAKRQPAGAGAEACVLPGEPMRVLILR